MKANKSLKPVTASLISGACKEYDGCVIKQVSILKYGFSAVYCPGECKNISKDLKELMAENTKVQVKDEGKKDEVKKVA